MKTLMILAALLCVVSVSTAAQDDKPLVEKVVNKNSEGVVVETYTTVDGKREGEYRAFHSDGSKRAVGSYKLDLAEGKWLYYFANGNPEQVCSYDKGNFQGGAIRYHENGNKACESSFEKGYAKGAWAEYHANGQIAGSGEVSSSRHNRLEDPVRQGKWV
ncbi:MAG: hypothetical protein OEY28_07325, partial [Nitrospira sp.]|nr:hypothetical protein [Nitrospira sp.]